MQLLLDTHAFLWWVEDAPPLSRKARSAIADPSNECLLSLASCWEMAIKLSLGKLKLRSPLVRFIPEQLATNGFTLLEIDFRDVARVSALKFHHRDPFDRLLASQAIGRQLAVVSADPVFRKYGVKRLW
jgi:PIN domain nuclease of toxin-antitoxin system